MEIGYISKITLPDNSTYSIKDGVARTHIDEKIFIDGLSTESLSMFHINESDFYGKVIAGTMLSNELYVVSSNYINAYGQQVKNLKAGTDLSDAVTLEQLSNAMSSIQMPTDLSSFSNSPGYLVLDELSSYCYIKSETSSASDISTALSAKADLSTLDDYAKIDELSSKADLSAIHGDYIKDATGNKIYADRTVEIVEQGEQSWTLTDGTNTYILTGTQTDASWSDGTNQYTLNFDINQWSLVDKYSMPGLPVPVKRWTEFLSGSASDTSLTFPTHGFTATWDDGKTVTEDELALKSDIPTKTSELSNDSEFATSSWVLEQNYISSVPDTYALKTEVNMNYVSSSKTIYLSAGSHVTSVDCTDFIKDGMLSTAELCGTTLVLTFNTDAGSAPISVEMSSFVDNYDSKINQLSDDISSLSDAVDERAMLSDIPLSTSQLINDSEYAALSDIPLSVSQLDNDNGYIVLSDIPADLSSFTNSPQYVMSSEVSSKLEEIDKKVFIDDRISGIAGYSDLSIIKLSASEYDQLVADDQTLSNNLYIVEDEFEDAYGQQVKNMARGTDLSDATTLEQLNEVSAAIPLSVSQLVNDSQYIMLSDVQIPTDLSSFTNSPGYLVSDDISGYYKKSETSSASEISGAIANAGKGYTVIVRKLDDEGIGNGWCFVGGNQIEAQAVSLPAGLRIQHVDTSITETSVYNQSFVVVPNGVNSGGYNTVYVNGAAKNNEVIQLTGDTLVELYYLFCFLEGTLVKLADGTTKKIEDITYDDVLSVWNFDEGCADSAKPLWINEPHVTTYCWETELSSGKKIRTTGIHGHRFFSLDSNKFLYADEVVGHNVWTTSGEDLVVSSKLVQGIKAKFYNIITEHHINLFAEGILAGCSLENGLYPVENMKFVKDSRAIRPYSEFEGIVSEEWYRACRYGESNLNYNYLCNYFKQRNPNMQTKKITVLANSGSNDLSSCGTINMYNYTLHNVGCGQMSSDVMNYKQITDEIADMLSTSLVSSIGTIPISSFDGLPDLKCSVNSIFDMLSNIVGILKRGSS